MSTLPATRVSRIPFASIKPETEYSKNPRRPQFAKSRHIKRALSEGGRHDADDSGTDVSTSGEPLMSPQAEHNADACTHHTLDAALSSSGPRTWSSQFRDAGRGVTSAIRGERSFRIHMAAAVSVVVAAGAFRVSNAEWAILLLCIGTVLSAETFNSSIESLAKAVTCQQDANVGRALDRAAGAVLLVSLGTAAAGLTIFVPHLIRLFTR